MNGTDGVSRHDHSAGPDRRAHRSVDRRRSGCLSLKLSGSTVAEPSSR